MTVHEHVSTGRGPRMGEAVDWVWTPQTLGFAALGWTLFASLTVYIVRRVLTGKHRPGEVVDRDMARVEKQRDDAIEALRESREVARLHAESIRNLAESVDKLADGQDVAVNLIRAALPQPSRGST